MSTEVRSATRILCNALAGIALLFGEAKADSAQNTASFDIVSQTPVLEVRFHGIALRGARGEQNQVALDFAAPVDSALFDRLQHTVPGWIDLAYGSYDNAVISSRRAVEFLTRNENDGFSLRLVAANQSADMPPAAPAAAGSAPSLPDGSQKSDTPFGAQDAVGAQPAPLSERVWHLFKGIF